MPRTTEQFSKALKNAEDLVKRHKKSFWIIPTENDYAISCFDDKRNLPDGTTTLEITPSDLENV